MMKIQKRQYLNLFLLFIAGAVFLTAAQPVAAGTVLVLPFESTQPNQAYKKFGLLLTDLLIVELSSELNDYEIVEREHLEILIEEMKLSLSGKHDPSQTVTIGKMASAELIIYGSFTIIQKNLHIICHLADAASARLLRSTEYRCSLVDIDSIAGQLIDDLFDSIDLEKSQQFPEAELELAPEQTLAFIKGMGSYYEGRYDEALAMYIKLLDTEPRDVKARFWMAKSYLALEEYEHAEIELKRVLSTKEKNQFSQTAQKLIKRCRAAIEKKHALD